MVEQNLISCAGVDEVTLVALAHALAPAIAGGGAIHLVGELGAGKTTFARALLGALGVRARIKSPTYSLIESYVAGGLVVHHLDLYRIAAADEMEWLGLRDLSVEQPLWLIEWPERAAAALPTADLTVNLAHAPAGRDVCIVAWSALGQGWLQRLAAMGFRIGSTAS